MPTSPENQLARKWDRNELAVGSPAAVPLAGPTSGISHGELLAILWRRRGIVLCVLTLCLVGAGMFLTVATPRYTSTSRIVVQQNAMRLLATDSQPAASEAGADSYTEVQAAMLHSAPVLQAALKQPELQGLKALRSVNDPLVYLTKQIDVSVGKKDGILSVSMETVVPEDGVKIVSAVVNSYVRSFAEQKYAKAAELVEILNAEKDKREQELIEQNRQIVQYKEANGSAFFETEHGNITLQDLEAASAQLTQAKLQVQSARAMRDVANSRRVGAEALAQAEQREKNYVSVVTALEEKARQVTSMKARFDVLESQAKRIERQLDLLDGRIKEVKAEEDAGNLNINVFEPARTDPKATYPRTPLILSLAILLGVIVGAALAIVAEWLDHRIRTPEEVSRLLDLPVLGVIPEREWSRERGVVRPIELAPPSSVTAEAYRSLRTAICFGASERPLKTILVASASSNDGKSTTVLNLAAALAGSGCRTLVIDANLHRPTQHAVFMTTHAPGLVELLRDPSQSPETAIRKTHVDGVDFLPSGTIPDNSDQLLGSEGFSELLESLCTKYERIVIDSPPTLGFSDARILAAQCDGVLLVVRAMKSTRRAVQQSYASLLHVGARMVGVAVNAVPGVKNYTAGYYGEYDMQRQMARHAGSDLVRDAHRPETTGIINSPRLNGSNGRKLRIEAETMAAAET